MKRKIIAYMATAFSLTALLSGCGNSNVDTTTSATAELLPLAEDVSVRVGTDPEGEALLDGTTIQGIMASDHYDTGTSSPYAYALVLSDEGKKQFRNATRELAQRAIPKSQFGPEIRQFAVLPSPVCSTPTSSF